MNASVIVMLLFCVSMTTCFYISQRSKRADEYFIQYVSSKGNVEAKQNVKIQEKEIQLEVPGAMTAVLDYDKMLMTMKHVETELCRTVKLNENAVPKLDDIIKELQKDGNTQEHGEQTEIKLDMARKVKLGVQKAKNQSPNLSSLSRQLCDGLEVEVYEQKTDDDTTTRQNCDIGWGEVVLIIVVIILL